MKGVSRTPPFRVAKTTKIVLFKRNPKADQEPLNDSIEEFEEEEVKAKGKKEVLCPDSERESDSSSSDEEEIQCSQRSQNVETAYSDDETQEFVIGSEDPLASIEANSEDEEEDSEGEDKARYEESNSETDGKEEGANDEEERSDEGDEEDLNSEAEIEDNKEVAQESNHADFDQDDSFNEDSIDGREEDEEEAIQHAQRESQQATTLLQTFLECLGLLRLLPRFEVEEIELLDLYLLSDRDLKEQFQIKLGPRKRIAYALKALSSEMEVSLLSVEKKEYLNMLLCLGNA